MKTMYRVTKSKMVLRTGSKPVTVPKINQRTPKGESSNKRLARKHTNMIITLANHIHTVTKHHMPETNAQLKMLYITAAKEKDTSVHTVELILFLVFRKTHPSRHSDRSVCSILAAQIELNDKATQFKLDIGPQGW